MNIGSGINGELTFLDTVGILSFLIGVQNLELNVTQEDAQNIQHRSDANAHLILDEIHNHLEEQDRKIDLIIKELEELKHGTERDL